MYAFKSVFGTLTEQNVCLVDHYPLHIRQARFRLPNGPLPLHYLVSTPLRLKFPLYLTSEFHEMSKPQAPRNPVAKAPQAPIKTPAKTPSAPSTVQSALVALPPAASVVRRPAAITITSSPRGLLGTSPLHKLGRATPSSRFFSSTPHTSCSAIIPSSIMADRDILPTTVKPSHYDLTVESLKFEDWSFQGRVT